ncbi:hypothetical protein [Actinacidiphila acidipaludis]|uniref:SRPBCC family protein n=1 Tax=Actinacidiphila acidipaludis TaxID=2873382 RepID=A0ABS7Q960_9ACTN|nr:hypothetical protein [Streptomyces acidipaludis]MBY8879666.1 hypothetical protein [Streptomyces acidipaludis]
MATVHFHMNSPMSPAEVMGVLTDFSPERAKEWPTIDEEHLTVHQRGDTWAEVTEGTAAQWEHARYEWDPASNKVTTTTIDSKVFGPGGGWVFEMTPEGEGTRVDIQLTREHPSTFKGKMLATILPFSAPVLRKSFKGPLKSA